MPFGRQPTVCRVAEHHSAVGTALLRTGMYPFRFSAKQMLFVRVSAGIGARGGVMFKALRYKPAGRGFDSRWCHWNFSVA
jgi:hypothetical protein